MTSAAADSYVYISPKPGSAYVSPHNNVVLRSDADLTVGSFGAHQFAITGTRSGIHRGAVSLSDDGRTLVFKPFEPFELGERVHVRVLPGARTLGGALLPPVEFSFAVAAADPRRQVPRGRTEVFGPAGSPAVGPPPREPMEPAAIGPLPPSYPPIILDLVNDPEPGHVFMTPNQPGTIGYGNLVIMDNRGEPIFYRKVPQRTADFRYQHRALTYFDQGTDQYLVLDSTYTVVDSFATGNGYITDLHEFQWLPNGHALLMAYDRQPVRMDSVVACGDSNAIVGGLIIQELDIAKNVVFQWRSWDHIPITDVDDCVEDICGPDIDYVHGNAIAADYDGHLMISSRHLNEITKVDRQTGEIIWRLGLNAKNNDFTFVGDTRGFSHQHDIRRLPNGNITLFDNGNCLSPQYSRGLEYHLDEVNKIATLVWEYRDTPDTYGRATGNTQRRPSGGTMINWGFGWKVTDLHPDDSKSMELHFGVTNMGTYRALRHPWETSRFVTMSDSIDFGYVKGFATRPLTIRNDWDRDVAITAFVASSPQFSVTDPVPFTLLPGASKTVTVKFIPQAIKDTATLYVRSVNDTELVARTVEVTGSGEQVTAVETDDSPSFALLGLGPNPSSGPMRISYAVAREASIRLSILDLQGRTVRVLADGRHTPGRHDRLWTQRDRVPTRAGVYFVRYEWPGGSSVRRVVLLP